MSLAQLHDLIQHCAECKLRHMDSRRVELDIAEGRAVAVDRHSGCGHVISYRNLHPARLGPEPVPSPTYAKAAKRAVRTHRLVKYRDPERRPTARNLLWRKLSA